MLINLDRVLNQDQLAVANDLLGRGKFAAGAASAGEMAQREKHNLELVADDAHKKGLDNLVMGALLRHPVYLNAGLPRRVAAPFFAIYGEGMGYGSHIDNPVMGAGEPYRSDIAITIFLNDPEDYEGGELEIQTGFGAQQVKLNAGDGVMYPASFRHQVNEVVSGERRVAVTWMQSLVPEADRRELLYQMYLAKENLGNSHPDAESTVQVEQSYCNLMRMWSRL